MAGAIGWRDASPTPVIRLDRPPMRRKTLTDEELDDLSVPPTNPDGGVLDVDFRLTVFHFGKVDTREQTSSVRMGVVMYWTDPRMAGWSHPILPPTLWGPDLWLKNSMGGVSIEYEQFVVVGVEEGRMKRILNFEATVITPMDLRNFPFDNQVLSPEWVSISHWKQFDGARFGSLPKGQSYRLRPVSRPDEGKVLMMFFNGRIPEWELHSYTTKVSQMKNPAGFTLTLIAVKFHLVRRYSYYMTKTVAPLCILTIGAHLIHALPPAELGDRLSNVFTMFLAAFALLYVVGEHVPRVDFLTTIDRVVYLTLFALIWLGLESSVVYYLDQVDGFDHALMLDRAAGGVTCLLFCVAVASLVLPAVRAQKADLKALEARQKAEHEEEVRAAQSESRAVKAATEIFARPSAAAKTVATVHTLGMAKKWRTRVSQGPPPRVGP